MLLYLVIKFEKGNNLQLSEIKEKFLNDLKSKNILINITVTDDKDVFNQEVKKLLSNQKLDIQV